MQTIEEIQKEAEEKYLEIPGWKAYNIHRRAEQRAYVKGVEAVKACVSELNGKILQQQDHIAELRRVNDKLRSEIAERDKRIFAQGESLLGLASLMHTRMTMHVTVNPQLQEGAGQ